jgi:hypothetical protein
MIPTFIVWLFCSLAILFFCTSLLSGGGRYVCGRSAKTISSLRQKRQIKKHTAERAVFALTGLQ